MENYKFTVEMNGQRKDFEVEEYAHHKGETCKLRIFKNSEYVAAFQPDSHHLLHLCQNPAGLEEGVLHLIADHLEDHFPFGGKHYQV